MTLIKNHHQVDNKSTWLFYWITSFW